MDFGLEQSLALIMSILIGIRHLCNMVIVSNRDNISLSSYHPFDQFELLIKSTFNLWWEKEESDGIFFKLFKTFSNICSVLFLIVLVYYLFVSI